MVRSTRPGGSSTRRGLLALLGAAVAVLGVVTALRIGAFLPGTAAAAATASAPVTSELASPTVVPSPTVAPTPTRPAPTVPPPTPRPTPQTVPGPLTGLPVSLEAALRHPIAVMVDDHVDARPQSGFNAASIVWHAPAEWGIPRYMLVFQDEIPAGVGPIRSARQYYVEWAAEYGAMYVHHGGSPQALATLSAKGNGQWVWNADGFRWIGPYLWRSASRFAPHNVYTDGEHLRDLAARLGADDAPLEGAWSFGSPASPRLRPDGGTITVTYPYESVTYRYDPSTNRYERFINGAKKPQVDRADGQVVAPANVVILRMAFGALSNGPRNHGRLEAQNVGTGTAWISTNGRTVKATWSKAWRTAPTLLFGPNGEQIRLTPGQTFVQVLALGYGLTIADGEAPAVTPPMQATHTQPL